MNLKKHNPRLFKHSLFKALLIFFIFSSKAFAVDEILNVVVTSGIDNAVLANQKVEIYQRQANGTLKSLRSETTDQNGYLYLDLPGLGSNAIYVLRTRQKHGNRKVFSNDIHTTESYTFKVGNVRAKIINGRTNTVLREHNIQVYKRGADGKYAWFASAKTDAYGLADFYLPDLDKGQRYKFKGTSLFDNSTWSSQEVSSIGITTFAIGNKLLNVVLVNALDQQPLGNTEVIAYQLKQDRTLQWHHKKNTDAKGRVDFELPGLGSGSKYVFTTRPYGISVKTKEIIDTGNFKIQVGSIAITLRRKSDGSLMKGQQLFLYEKIATGKLEWRATSKTSDDGRVHFDSERLGTGTTFVVRGKNLFGNNNNYYSQWILSKGRFDFIVDPDDPHKLDEESPVFKSVYPQNYSPLSDKGFVMRMKVSDNIKVDRVGLRIYDTVKGITSGEAALSNNEWMFAVTSKMISSGQSIVIEAEAEDHVGNKTLVKYYYSIINDLEKPNIAVTSHIDGSQIDERGFFITGIAWDNTDFVKLFATVSDSVNGVVINQKEIEIGKTGNWAFVAKDLPKGKEVTVELKAIDAAGNEAAHSLTLKVTIDTPRMVQLINRMTFGATPELIKQIRFYGAETFINMQLYPEFIDDSELETQLEALNEGETDSYRRLLYAQISRAMYSKRQLLEVMTQFWESHFNTNLGKVHNVDYEEMENNLFRQHALGNFRDLLQISAKSPAMLVYLDNKDSHNNEPNENYARELMELHTLGVDNRYTSEDIAEVARVFTGWRVSNGAFYFHKGSHDDDYKIVLGTSIPAGLGVEGGERVLELLAGQAGTAQFICTKLLKVFVSDAPTINTVKNCADIFLANVDQYNQIAIVLEGIFKSPEFSESLTFHNKVKTPFEFVIGLARQLPFSPSYANTATILTELGMSLYYYPEPTGWPEDANYWVNSNQLMSRWQVARETVFNAPAKWRNYINDPGGFLVEQGIETTEGVLGFLFELTLDHDYSKDEWDQALALLNKSGTEKFDIYASDADVKIRNVLSLLLQYPAYQLQ